MRAGRNVWILARELEHLSRAEFRGSDYQPSSFIKNDGEDPSYFDGHELVAYYPWWAQHRVRGYTYTPYQGSTDWVKKANQAMGETAQYNFK